MTGPDAPAAHEPRALAHITAAPRPAASAQEPANVLSESDRRAILEFRATALRASRGTTRAKDAAATALPHWLARCRPTPTSRTEPNGRLSVRNLCALPIPDMSLRTDAAIGWWRLDQAYEKRFGESMCINSAYRSVGQQASLYAAKPGLVAPPGTSNHGWGVAIDLCDGPDSFGSVRHAWMRAKAGYFGWVNPSWAQQGGSRPEPWHWEYHPALDMAKKAAR